MSFVTFSVKHGGTLDQAKAQLRTAVGQVQSQLGGMIDRTEWAADGSAVKVWGKGFEVEMRVDPADVHVAGNLTFLGGLMSGPVGGMLKQIVQKSFQKRLT